MGRILSLLFLCLVLFSCLFGHGFLRRDFTGRREIWQDASTVSQAGLLHALMFSGIDAATSCENLVNFGPVTPEFTRLNCVQQASVSTWVSLTAFARGRHCYAARATR